jgi:soluble lytic murein transglycosylase
MPISVARGAYWAGRAAEAKGDPASTRWYTAAAKHQATYYGQLAAFRMGNSAPPKLVPEPTPSKQEIAAFDKKEIVRAARMLDQLGERDRMKPFVLRLSDLAKSPTEHALAARLAEEMGRLDLSVSLAKRASYVGVPLMQHGYPVLQMDRGGLAEKPLVLAMTRQESAFDVAAVSRAGARGLMQLMPTTAKEVAKQQGLPYNADRLLSDPTYNLTLGRAFLDGLLERFSGSYVLSVAAYNAGPARVWQWVQQFGDPREPNVDVIDWIELIPFNETRSYVQRVLENLQVYRVRLGDTQLAFSLHEDLRR